ncbi:hypothetical protein B0H14DRAFT_3448930 [Mycena olivaceomarginata]|nr:hypothetical protein B0H14DRAFT_3448930 [Mycena olivaceomarginata]
MNPRPWDLPAVGLRNSGLAVVKIGHGESAALPLLLLQIAAVTVGLPQHRFYLCRWTAAPLSYCHCATAAAPQQV